MYLAPLGVMSRHILSVTRVEVPFLSQEIRIFISCYIKKFIFISDDE